MSRNVLKSSLLNASFSICFQVSSLKNYLRITYDDVIMMWLKLESLKAAHSCEDNLR